MILYYQSNEINGGQISNGKSAITQNNDLLWDENDNILRQINGSFYVKVNAELYSKSFKTYSQKTYNYPGIYELKCYYKNEPSLATLKRVTVKDCKLALILNLLMIFYYLLYILYFNLKHLN